MKYYKYNDREYPFIYIVDNNCKVILTNDPRGEGDIGYQYDLSFIVNNFEEISIEEYLKYKLLYG